MRPATTVFLLIGLVSTVALAEEQGDWRERAASFESEHPYPASKVEVIEIREPGASFVRVHFSRLELEEDFDFLEVLDAAGTVVERYTGEHRDLWSPPVEGDTIKLRLISDASVVRFGYTIDRIAFRLPGEVVSPVRSLDLDAPGRQLKAGQSLPLTVTGAGPTGATVDLRGHPIYFNLHGPIRVLAVELPHRYKIVAEADLRSATEARVIAYSARSAAIAGEIVLSLRPARPLESLALTGVPERIVGGGSFEFEVTGLPRDGRGTPERLRPDEVVVALEGPGRIVPIDGSETARYGFEAPLAVNESTAVVITVRLLDEEGIAGRAELQVEKPVFPRPPVVAEEKGLVKITSHATRQDYQDPWVDQRLPRRGQTFVAPEQNHRFGFQVNREGILQIEVDVAEIGSREPPHRYASDAGNLDLTIEGRSVRGEFKEQFREGRGEYQVTFYVWTAPDQVVRDSITVLRARR